MFDLTFERACSLEQDIEVISPAFQKRAPYKFFPGIQLENPLTVLDMYIVKQYCYSILYFLHLCELNLRQMSSLF